MYSFKPCYKWITFNTEGYLSEHQYKFADVLNLVINGLPSILTPDTGYKLYFSYVLNLVINGLPSIL